MSRSELADSFSLSFQSRFVTMVSRSLNRIVIFIVSGWAIVELIFCAIFLYQPEWCGLSPPKGDFLEVLCDHKCNEFYKTALFGRMITLALLLLGNILVSRCF